MNKIPIFGFEYNFGDEGREIGHTFELQQEQEKTYGKTYVFDIIETWDEILATKAQAKWIMSLFALKVNQRYSLLLYKWNVVWVFFILCKGLGTRNGYYSNDEVCHLPPRIKHL